MIIDESPAKKVEQKGSKVKERIARDAIERQSYQQIVSAKGES